MANDPLMPKRPWRGDYLGTQNQYGPSAGKPVIIDCEGGTVAVFERTVDRDLVLLALDALPFNRAERIVTQSKEFEAAVVRIIHREAPRLTQTFDRMKALRG